MVVLRATWARVVDREEDVERLARSLRLVLGLGMIAAGTSLAAPAGLQLAAWWQARTLAVPAPPDGLVRGLVASPGGPPPGGTTSQAPFADTACPGDRPPALQSNYVPPPPTPPLPPPAPALSAAGPNLASQYRTTLAVPPPPLIDGQRPPPVALGWAARIEEPRRTFVAQPEAVHQARYRVRDGDDLTAIAIRFYGNPAAASAIWQANRAILTDPGLLPIGADLVLPHPDALGSAAGGRPGRSIEPAVGGPPVRPVAAPVGPAWLDGG